MARVDLPAPRIPVMTMEASGSKTLMEEKSEVKRGEPGAERDAAWRQCCQYGSHENKARETGCSVSLPRVEGGCEVRGEGSETALNCRS